MLSPEELNVNITLVSLNTILTVVSEWTDGDYAKETAFSADEVSKGQFIHIKNITCLEGGYKSVDLVGEDVIFNMKPHLGGEWIPFTGDDSVSVVTAMEAHLQQSPDDVDFKDIQRFLLVTLKDYKPIHVEVDQQQLTVHNLVNSAGACGFTLTVALLAAFS